MSPLGLRTLCKGEKNLEVKEWLSVESSEDLDILLLLLPKGYLKEEEEEKEERAADCKTVITVCWRMDYGLITVLCLTQAGTNNSASEKAGTFYFEDDREVVCVLVFLLSALPLRTKFQTQKNKNIWNYNFSNTDREERMNMIEVKF